MVLDVLSIVMEYDAIPYFLKFRNPEVQGVAIDPIDTIALHHCISERPAKPRTRQTGQFPEANIKLHQP
jgi:hypothetical protein